MTRYSTGQRGRSAEELGLIVRRVWINEYARKGGTKPAYLAAWEEMPEDDREVDRIIGMTLYALGREDVVEQLLREGWHGPDNARTD